MGCSNSFKYSDNEVAAIVKGEEITIGELRFLYPDHKVLDMIDGTVKAELVVQEAKKMNFDVSEEVKVMVEGFGSYPPSDHVDAAYANSIREFVEPQAKKLGLEPEKYYEKYIEKTSEMTEYINAYMQAILGEPTDNIEEYNELANQILDDLVEKNQDQIQILIK